MDIEPRDLEHHLHEVLADVVDIPLHSADDHDSVAPALLGGYGDQGPEHVESRIEGLGAHKQFGDEARALFVKAAQLSHAGNQPAEYRSLRVDAGGHSLACDAGGRLLVAVLNGFRQKLQDLVVTRHAASLESSTNRPRGTL